MGPQCASWYHPLPLPLKNTTLLFPVKPPLFREYPPLHLFFREPTSLKVGFFTEHPKYYSFSSLTPSYLLKVTKFFAKISQFEFLVITEKNIFLYKLFLSLNIWDFSLFFCKNCTPPPPKKQRYPTLFQQPPLSTLRGGGVVVVVHTMGTMFDSSI